MPRRQGQLIKRSDTRWLIRIFRGIHGATGKRTYSNTPFSGTQEEAEAQLRKMVEKRGKHKRILAGTEPGYIYCVLAIELFRVKIGFTTNMAQRFALLQTGSPANLTIIGFWPGTFTDEKAIHKQFSDKQACGEYFDLDGELFVFIQERMNERRHIEDVTHVWAVDASRHNLNYFTPELEKHCREL